MTEIRSVKSPGQRVGGALLVVFGVLLLLFGAAAMVVSYDGTLSSIAGVPLAVFIFGGLLSALGGKLLKSGEQAHLAASVSTAAPSAPVKNANPVGAVIGLLVFGGLIWFYYGGGLENEANRKMQEIENKVASDAVDQYGIAKRNGSAMDACVQAGMVTAAYLQAKDEANYQKWKQTEKTDCSAAGLNK